MGLPVLYLLANVLFFAPFDVVFGNREEFTLPFTTLVFAYWPIWLAVLLPAMFLGWLLPRSVYPRVAAPLYALALLTWLQGNVLPASYGAFDAVGIDWSQFAGRSWLDLPIWFVFLGAALLFPRRVLEPLKIVAHVLIAGQVLLAGFHALTGPAVAGEDGVEPPPAELFEFSSTRNVFYLLLDEFSSEIFAELVAQEPELRAQLAGFTFYERNVGIFPTTRVAIPALSTAQVYRNQEPVGTFEAGLVDRTIAHHLAESGYTVAEAYSVGGVRPDTNAPTIFYRVPFPYVSAERYARYWQAALLDLALFRSLPHRVKRALYADGEWTLRRQVEEDPQFHPTNALRFAEQFLDEMHVADAAPRYRFLHLIVPHEPAVLGADCGFVGLGPYSRQALVAQSRCALRLAFRFLDRLKELGIYESSGIVLSADHGSRRASESFEATDGLIDPSIVGPALALLAVKPPAATGPLRDSRAPTSLLDLPATLCDLAGVEHEFAGRSVLSIAEDEVRPREFFYYQWQDRMWGNEYMPGLSRYEVEGDPMSEASWRSLGWVFPPTTSLAASDVDIGTEGARAYLGLGWSVDEVDSRGRTFAWAMGSQAIVNVSLSSEEDTLLVATLSNPSINPGQSIEVWVDGEHLTTWNIGADGRWQELEARIPRRGGRPRISMISLRFATHHDEVGKRSLSVCFDRIEVRPNGGD